MIYGPNFGGPAIPDTPRSAFRKFKRRIRVQPDCGCFRRQHRFGLGLCRGPITDDPKPVTFLLVGIAQSEAELERALVVATNGCRRLHVERRSTAGGDWFGIYAY